MKKDNNDIVSCGFRTLSAALLAIVLLYASGCAVGPKKDIPPPALRVSDFAGAGFRAAEAGDYEGARGLFSRAVDEARRVDDRRGELLSLINLARVSLVLGDYKGARSYLSDAISLAVHTGDSKNLSESYATLSKVSYYDGTVEEALDYIERAIELDRKNGSVDTGAKLNMKGLLYMRSGREAEALTVLNEAVEANRKAGADLELANSYRALAALRAPLDAEAALELYTKAHAMDSALGDPRKIAVDLRGMADANLLLGRLEEAAFLFERACMVSINASLYEDALENIEKLISVLTDMGRLEEAGRYREIREKITKNLQTSDDI